METFPPWEQGTLDPQEIKDLGQETPTPPMGRMGMMTSRLSHTSSPRFLDSCFLPIKGPAP